MIELNMYSKVVLKNEFALFPMDEFIELLRQRAVNQYDGDSHFAVKDEESGRVHYQNAYCIGWDSPIESCKLAKARGFTHVVFFGA